MCARCIVVGLSRPLNSTQQSLNHEIKFFQEGKINHLVEFLALNWMFRVSFCRLSCLHLVQIELKSFD